MIKNVADLRILLIEDSKTDAILIKKVLTKISQNNYNVHIAENITSALKILGSREFDVILLDLSLPDAFEFNGLLSLQNMVPAIPVIILTANVDEELALKAVEYGAQDYLFKESFNGHHIKRAIEYAIQRKEFEGALIKRANYDALTGLANRILFESRLDMAIARGKRTKDGVGILFLDLDKFKQVNDTLGHAAGDNLLKQVSVRLKQSIRPYDTAARFGGDEFALIIEGIKQSKDCIVVAQKIIQKIGEPLIIANKKATIGVSIGIATYPVGENLSREFLMKQADEAMYNAKTTHSSYQLYSEKMSEQR